ncbi:MAG: preprotein translocase subunit SecE [Desulfovibrio sp.]
MAKKKGKNTGSQKASSQESGLVAKFSELKTFFEESKVEIKKVVWPTRSETIATCSAVVVLVLVMSLFLGVVDLGLTKLVEAILS